MHSLHGDDLRKNARMQMPSSNDVGARQSARSTEHAKEVKSRQINRAPGGGEGGGRIVLSLFIHDGSPHRLPSRQDGWALAIGRTRAHAHPSSRVFFFSLISNRVTVLPPSMRKKERKTLTLDAAMRSVQHRRFHIWTFQTLPSPAPSYAADPFKFFRSAPGGLERKPRERKREMRNPCGWNRGRVSSLPCGLLRGNIF